MAEVNVQIRNFFNRKPTTVIYYTTLEIYHPAFGSIRFVRDYADRMFTLEADAPRNAGETVEFTALMFEAPEPDQEDVPNVRIRINLGRIGSGAKAKLKQIQGFDFFEPMQIIFRRFITTDTSGPVKTHRLYAQQPIIKGRDVVLTATDDNPSRQNVSRLYRFEDYPGLEVL